MVALHRRALLTAAAVAPALLPAAASAAVPAAGSLAATWAKAQAYAEHINAKSYPDDPTCAELYADCNVHGDLERTVLTGPIATPADAAAKVRCALNCINEGGHTDGSDHRALLQVALWLEAR